MEIENFESAEPLPAPMKGKVGRYFAVFAVVVKQGVTLLVVGLLAYAFFQFSHKHLVQTVQVEGGSMTPTLRDKQCYLLNRTAFLVREPKPMDIVVLQDPETNGYAVKRIVAQPGDRVFVKGGQVFVNGRLLLEPYLERGTRTFPDSRYDAQMWICGVDQYFVLGDNRNNSADSRGYGAVARRNILGRLVGLDSTRWF